ncbi:MAG TPA: hypothetical protein VEA35_05640, partial [Ramlibacter sp.]|nr:hypothetical protein [Ramlibacter sp.]
MPNLLPARATQQRLAIKKVASGKSFWGHARYVLSDNPFTLVAAGLFTLFVLMAVIGPWIAPYDPLAT